MSGAAEIQAKCVACGKLNVSREEDGKIKLWPCECGSKTFVPKLAPGWLTRWARRLADMDSDT